MPIQSVSIPVTIMKSMTVQLNDKKLPLDDVINISMTNSFFTFGITGAITFKDTYSLANSQSFKFDGSTTITLIFFDYMQNRRKFIFNVIDMDVDDSARVYVITLKFIDPFAFALHNLYVPKSFNGTITDAFSQIVSNYSLERELTKNALSLEIGSSSEVRNFVMTSGLSAYDFFSREFRRANIRMWQDEATVYVKEFRLSSADKNDLKYSTNSNNQNYLFRIHDFKKYDVSKSAAFVNLPAKLVTRFSNKTVIQDTVNLDDFYSDLILNNNDMFKNLQGDAVGKSYSIMNDTVGAQKYDLFNTFIENEKLDIVVPGTLKENQPGRVITVEIGDKSQYVKARQLGNRTSSGKWFIKTVQSRFFGGRFIQRLRLGRFDHPRV